MSPSDDPFASVEDSWIEHGIVQFAGSSAHRDRREYRDGLAADDSGGC